MDMNHKHGFTLVEVATAVTLLVMALALALAGYMFSLKNINQGDIQNELDMDVQLAMERLKIDLRLSSLDTMFYYPSGAGPYEAISFPLAEDNDGDGVLEKDDEGKIIWDKTVIYHVRPTTPNQLVKTTFSPRDNTLSDAQRQAQLENVVKVGDGKSTFNSRNTSSKVIFENLLNWKIMPEKGYFDAFSPVLTRDSSGLGYILLNPGAHKITFNVVDKNSNSRGYKMGIDQLFVSPSYSAREAEAQLPAYGQSGATATAQYMPGDWKGNYQLSFPATEPGNRFTLILDNDRWEETNFGATGYEARDTEVVFDHTLTPKDFAVQLKGNDITWEATEQTFAKTGTPVTNELLRGSTVAIHINGSQLFTNGNWIVNNGKRCKLTFQASSSGQLQVENVRIARAASLETISFTHGSSKSAYFSGASASPVMTAGSTATSDWIDFDINTTNSYVVTFQIRNEAGKCYPMALGNQLGGYKECLVNGANTNYIFGLSSITASYPATGEYTSQVFDTHLTSPKYGDISWSSEIPANTTLSLKVRSGDKPDLSDASDWDTISASTVNPRAVGTSYKRYIQFQALFTTDPTTATTTPQLKDVTIDWTGEQQLVNVGGIFTKGPDYGIFEISVDGNPLRSALIVDLEIYKDILVMNKESRRVTSALQSDLTPRNSGM